MRDEREDENVVVIVERVALKVKKKVKVKERETEIESVNIDDIAMAVRENIVDTENIATETEIESVMVRETEIENIVHRVKREILPVQCGTQDCLSSHLHQNERN